jgi:hypothetical protein
MPSHPGFSADRYMVPQQLRPWWASPYESHVIMV